MKILAIDTSCDETAAAVTEETAILSNVVWSQASAHAKFGGVMPSLAQRMHEERIDWVINKALENAQCSMSDVQCLAVTAGPGLAIALEVGIRRAKELARELKIPLIPVNHVEGHVLSPLAYSRGIKGGGIVFPAIGLVVSGKHTDVILIKKIGDYEILAETMDDALGEALDKAARMLGLGYPGGAIMEKMAKEGNPKMYPLPLPMARREEKNAFSYSGLKTAFFRLTESLNRASRQAGLSKEQIQDLAAVFQDRAFEHVVRISARIIQDLKDKEYKIKDLLVGGGVGANVELRNRLRKMANELDLKVHFPYSTRLYGDNAAMIGVAAGFNIQDLRFRIQDLNLIDREPRARIDKGFKREENK